MDTLLIDIDYACDNYFLINRGLNKLNFKRNFDTIYSTERE